MTNNNRPQLEDNNNDHTHPIPSDAPYKIYNHYIYYLEAPEGPMEIVILEDTVSAKAIGILGHCGKSGTIVMSWMDAFCRIVSKQLEDGKISINELREQLSNTTSGEVRTDYLTGVRVSSGPEAIFIALSKYSNDKYEELTKQLGTISNMSRHASTNRVE